MQLTPRSFFLISTLSLVIISKQVTGQQPNLMLPVGHTERVVSSKFSPDGKLVITISTDGTGKLWESETGKLLKDFKSGGDASISLVIDANFNETGTLVFIYYDNKETRIYDLATGRSMNYIDVAGQNISYYASDAVFNPNGSRFLLGKAEKNLLVCDFNKLKPVYTLRGHKEEIVFYNYSPDGKKIVSLSSDNNFRTWNAATGQLLNSFYLQEDSIRSFEFSMDGKKLFCEKEDEFGSLLIIDATNGKRLQRFRGARLPKTDQPDYGVSHYSADDKLWIRLFGYYTFYDSTLQISFYDSIAVHDLGSGKFLYGFGQVAMPANTDYLSYDSKKIIITRKIVNSDTAGYLTGSIKVVEARTGRELYTIPTGTEQIFSAQFSPDSRKIITSTGENSVRTWDAGTGQLLNSLKNIRSTVYEARFSPDNKKIITAGADKVARIWNMQDEKQLVELKGRTVALDNAKFDSTGKNVHIFTAAGRNLVWDIENNSLSPYRDSGIIKPVVHDFHVNFRGGQRFNSDSSLMLLFGVDILMVQEMFSDKTYHFWDEEKEIKYDAQFSPDFKRILVTTANNTIKLYDLQNPRPIFTFVALDSVNFLVADSNNRYDGTDAARGFLYFTCGKEVIELDQVKDQLWVPNLAQRIQAGEIINAKSLSELGICGLTPLVEEGKNTPNEYVFKIKSRRGGLGETVLSLNGRATNFYQPDQLKKIGDQYELRIKRSDLDLYFQEGVNNISVRSYTSDNISASRNISLIEDASQDKKIPPTMYGVMVGVSDYKGTDMDLDYAAVDANEISKVLSIAAKKFLGNEKVVMYNLTTDKERFLLPEKKSIRSVFEEIGKKATPNDILFIFLSGHGVVSEKNKQFYYLTADASPSADESLFDNIGISTAELTEWIKPQRIKVQKCILVLDACYSGQAINSFVKLGNERQGFLAAKDDDNAQRLRAIDKLNEKSGLFILSASSSNQRAWESGVYSHGYLTYSLLKALKYWPGSLGEKKYLDVKSWLDAAVETVSEIARKDGNVQQPQVFSTTNFNIGLVDEELTQGITLSETKPLFSSGSFLNAAILDDDQDIRKSMDKRLDYFSREEGEKKLIFLSSSNSPEAFYLNGSYTTNDNVISLTVILKQGREVKKTFDPVAGPKDQLNNLIDDVINKALDWISVNK